MWKDKAGHWSRSPQAALLTGQLPDFPSAATSSGTSSMPPLLHFCSVASVGPEAPRSSNNMAFVFLVFGVFFQQLVWVLLEFLWYAER